MKKIICFLCFIIFLGGCSQSSNSAIEQALEKEKNKEGLSNRYENDCNDCIKLKMECYDKPTEKGITKCLWDIKSIDICNQQVSGTGISALKSLRNGREPCF